MLSKKSASIYSIFMGISMVEMWIMFYTLIVSPGYFLQQGKIELVIMFAVFMILAVLSTVLAIKQSIKD